MNDLVESARITRGSIKVEGIDINDPRIDVVNLRRNVGMVFQKSNPFPKSIYDNIAYGLRIAGITKRSKIDEARSEEHTSELQSRQYLVCRLLLEKKNTNLEAVTR